MNVARGIGGSAGFPMDVIMMLGVMDMEAQVVPDFEKGLTNLKNVSEAEADRTASSDYTI